jgi:hypothetical protein
MRGKSFVIFITPEQSLYDDLATHYNSIRKHHVESPTFNITLQTDGFTYHGRHTDNVIIDKRTLSSKTMAYIALK